MVVYVIKDIEAEIYKKIVIVFDISISNNGDGKIWYNINMVLC